MLIRLSWFDPRTSRTCFVLALADRDGNYAIRPNVAGDESEISALLVPPRCLSSHWTGQRTDIQNSAGQVHAGAWRHTDDYTAGDVHSQLSCWTVQSSAWNMCCKKSCSKRREITNL